MLAAALRATNAPTEADRERELARRLSAGYEQELSSAAEVGPENAWSGSAHTSSARRCASRFRVDLAPDGATSQSWWPFTSIAAGDSSSAKTTGARSTELHRAIYLSPYQAEAHLLVGRLASADRPY